MQSFRHNGHAIHYADEGPRDGIPVVFSNSLGTDFRVWTPLLSHLPENLRIIRYDKAGHGLSDFAGERSIDAHADDVAALMTYLDVNSAVIIGLSVGGLIAQAMAANHPEKVRALVLCDTGHKIGSAEIWNPRFDAIEAGGMEAVANPTMERWFTQPFHASPTFPIWRTMLVRTPAEGYCAVGRAIRDADYTESTKRIAVPTLCVVGAQDGATPPALVKELADLIKGAHYEVIDECGHLPCVEQPQRLGTLIREFLSGLA